MLLWTADTCTAHSLINFWLPLTAQISVQLHGSAHQIVFLIKTLSMTPIGDTFEELRTVIFRRLKTGEELEHASHIHSVCGHGKQTAHVSTPPCLIDVCQYSIQRRVVALLSVIDSTGLATVSESLLSLETYWTSIIFSSTKFRTSSNWPSTCLARVDGRRLPFVRCTADWFSNDKKAENSKFHPYYSTSLLIYKISSAAVTIA